MDYKREKGLLKSFENKEFYKPSPGTVQVIILCEPVEKEYRDPETNLVKGQIEFLASFDGVKKYWTITKGLTPASLYGQLVLVGAEFGHLEGIGLTLHIKQAGNRGNRPKHDYSVINPFDSLLVGGDKGKGGQK